MAKGKQVAAPKGKVVAKKVSKEWKADKGHLFTKDPRDYRIGRDILPAKRNLSRYVKWPRYVRIQRQRAVLKKRLKVPPSLNQFSKTLDKNQASNLFRLLSKYRPESAAEKKTRLVATAEAESKNQDVNKGSKPKHIKYGLNHITELIESKKAKLVIIAHDVDPVELVIWLPALCRKMDVPYCIVKGKARLGQFVYKKTATAIAITEVNKEDNAKLEQLVSNFRVMYNDAADRKRWGGGVMGTKANHVIKAREKARNKELAKSALVSL
jgi:large subunit ribosomal protein L7Ae